MSAKAVRRPSLPLGTQVTEDLSVARPLLIEGDVEVYLLERRASEDWLLVSVRVDQETLPGVQAWWAGQGAAGSRIEVASPSAELAPDAHFFVVRVPGVRACDTEQLDPTGIEARELAGALLDVAKAALGAGMVPHLGPKAVWIASVAQQRTLFAPVPRLPLPASESVILRDLGSTLYHAMAGIDLEANPTARPSPLGGWLADGDRSLAEVVERCVGAGEAPSFATLGELSAELSLGSDASGPAACPSLAEVLAATERDDGTKVRKGLAAVAGMQDLKALLREEVIAPLRDPDRFRRYGLTVPNGILLYGPPGCGKTYIARKLAEELGFRYFEIVPSEISSSFIHGTVIKIREVFDRAAEHAPALVFIDEFEALAPSRRDLAGHQQYKAEEVNELLVQMNGAAERRIVLLVATNEAGGIDPAILRTGRLDKHIEVGLPDAQARREMLEFHLEGRPVAKGLAWDEVTDALEGRSASDLKFLVDEAARFALQTESDISTAHLLNAISQNPNRDPDRRPEDDFTGFRLGG